MKRTRRIKTPGRAIELTVPLGPPAGVAPEPIPDCEPAISGLYWFSDSTGLYDQEVEASYLLAEGAAGPVLGVAGLVGDDCRLPVTWAQTWTPASGTGGDPGYFEDGGRLAVYPLADTAPGVLEVTAEHDGNEYGPILLTVLRYSCYYGQPSASVLLGWSFLSDPSARMSFDGYANPIPESISAPDVGISIAPGSYPIGFSVFIRFPLYPQQIAIDSYTCDSIQLISSGDTYAKFDAVVSGDCQIVLRVTDSSGVERLMTATVSAA